jgi:uncharacterized protein YcbK (DUF882 family)
MIFAKWEEYKYFTSDEFNCRYTGKNEMRHEFMLKLEALRRDYGKPITISSGYRHPSHPVERIKTISGAHTSGQACDIAIANSEAYRLLELAFKHGFKRIGINQKGNGRFIHLDTLERRGFPTPTIWSY